jgi:hypothetical protein
MVTDIQMRAVLWASSMAPAVRVAAPAIGLRAFSSRMEFLPTIGTGSTPYCCLTTNSPRTGMKTGSNVQGLEIGGTRAREVSGLFNELIFDPAHLRHGEGFDPVDAALAERLLRALRLAHSDVLEMHREETAWVLREVVGGNQASRDGGHLELELDELGVEQVEQPVLSSNPRCAVRTIFFRRPLGSSPARN